MATNGCSSPVLKQAPPCFHIFLVFRLPSSLFLSVPFKSFFLPLFCSLFLTYCSLCLLCLPPPPLPRVLLLAVLLSSFPLCLVFLPMFPPPLPFLSVSPLAFIARGCMLFGIYCRKIVTASVHHGGEGYQP